jgi:LPXTG-site transpeptidase (sortase) family protein
MKNFISLFFIIAGIIAGVFTTSFFRKPFTQFYVSHVQQSQKKAVPTRISIPKLHITTTIESVGKDKTGAMDVPKDINNVAWYSLGPKPGQIGSAVIGGHYDSRTGPAVFYNLEGLEKGDTVIVEDADKKQYSFKVVDKQKYDYSSFPVSDVFGKTDKPYLNLITCTGVFDTSQKMYLQRLVVRTQLDKINYDLSKR